MIALRLRQALEQPGKRAALGDARPRAGAPGRRRAPALEYRDRRFRRPAAGRHAAGRVPAPGRRRHRRAGRARRSAGPAEASAGGRGRIAGRVPAPRPRAGAQVAARAAAAAGPEDPRPRPRSAGGAEALPRPARRRGGGSDDDRWRRSKALPRDLLAAHVAFAQDLAASDEESGEARLWAGEAGEALAEFLAELSEALGDVPPIEGRRWPALLESLLAGRVLRPRYGRHPRLAIWGPLEARLQTADLVILGGLNEGSWPQQVPVDPWFSRPMRRSLGLASAGAPHRPGGP